MRWRGSASPPLAETRRDVSATGTAGSHPEEATRGVPAVGNERRSRARRAPEATDELVTRVHFDTALAQVESRGRGRRGAAVPPAESVSGRDAVGLASRSTPVNWVTADEMLLQTGGQDSLNARLDGLDGSSTPWGLRDPVDADGWGGVADRDGHEAAASHPAVRPGPAGAGRRRGAPHDRDRPARQPAGRRPPPGRARADPRRQRPSPTHPAERRRVDHGRLDEIGLLFRRVRAEVLAATNGEQRR